MKRFICGICKRRNKFFISDRKDLRRHLREDHRIMKAIANSQVGAEGQPKKRGNQDWWITEEIKPSYE